MTLASTTKTIICLLTLIILSTLFYFSQYLFRFLFRQLISSCLCLYMFGWHLSFFLLHFLLSAFEMHNQTTCFLLIILYTHFALGLVFVLLPDLVVAEQSFYQGSLIVVGIMDSNTLETRQPLVVRKIGKNLKKVTARSRNAQV